MATRFNKDATLFDYVVHNGNGVKGLVDLGLPTVPRRYVQPPEERIDNLKASKFDQPPIDISKLEGLEHEKVVNQIVKAAETVGFFQVVNHGVPLELLESVKDTAHKFFTQPPKKKAIYCKGVSPSPLVKYGTSFAPEKEKALEWKDYISMVYTNDNDALQHWPQECREVALEYLNTSIKMTRKVLDVLIRNLGGCFEDSRIKGLTGFKLVNMNYYPKCPNPELTVGVGRHSDMGTLTCLLQDGIGGLYVKTEEGIECGNKEQWMEIPPIPGALVINVGDSLQILSNGRYKSAEHRVRTTSTQSRVSIPVFTAPNPTERIGPLPHLVKTDGKAEYRDVVFQEYMDNFFANAHQGKKSIEFART